MLAKDIKQLRSKFQKYAGQNSARNLRLQRMKQMLKMRVNQIEIPVENTSSTDRKDKVEIIYLDIYKEEKCNKNCNIGLRLRI